mgnify:CR=1 FL=1
MWSGPAAAASHRIFRYFIYFKKFPISRSLYLGTMHDLLLIKNIDCLIQCMMEKHIHEEIIITLHQEYST